MSRCLQLSPYLLLALACTRDGAAPEPAIEPRSSGELIVEVTAESGVSFVHDNGATEHRLLPETMGSGVALLDYDGDGRLDLFFVNGSAQSSATLYRNLGGWQFEEVSERAGVGVRLVGMGVAAGDIDHDGTIDLFITGVGSDVLLRNRGDGTFDDASDLLGDLPPGFGSSAAFLDADGDEWVDLFVGRYISWTPQDDVACLPDGVRRSYCTPEVYSGASNHLLRNLGDLRGFVDITAAAGLYTPEGKTLGVVPLDYDNDGKLDLAVANDTVRNFLFINRGDGTFDEQAVKLGMAYSESGAPRGGMGIDAGNLFGEDCADVVVGNFAQEMSAVFRCGDGGQYTDDAAQLGVGLPSLLTLAFGTLIVDIDLDGWKDVIFANGHIEPDIESLRPNQSYAQPIQIFRQAGGEQRFEPVEAKALSVPRVGRGLAVGDLDGDGDPDLVITQNGGPAVLLRNEGLTNTWLGMRLRSGPAGGDAYGSRATVITGGRQQSATLVSGRSYLSASEPSITFGLGASDEVEAVEVMWPSGRRMRIERPRAGRILTLVAHSTDM